MAEETGTAATETTDTTAAPEAGAAAATPQPAANATHQPEGEAAAAADRKESADAQKESAEQKPADKVVDYAKALAEVKLPEGMAITPETSKAAVDLFTKHRLTADAVKDLTAFSAQQQKAGADGNAKAFATQVQGWKAEAEKSTTAEERGTAKDAVLKVFPKELVSVLETFGLTNRADFIKAMGTLGKAIKDDVFVPGSAGANGSANDARRLFPNSTMNP